MEQPTIRHLDNCFKMGLLEDGSIYAQPPEEIGLTEVNIG